MKNIQKIARESAHAICKGFILHDEKKYNTGAKEFSKFFKNLFDLTSKKAVLAGKYYMDLFRIHDFIEDKFIGTSKQIFNHKLWRDIHRSALNLCKICKINKEFADNYIMFLRYHTAFPKNKKKFILYLLAAERAFVFSLTKDKIYAVNLSPLYLAGVGGHDVHTKRWWKFTEDIMTISYKMILLRKFNISDKYV